MNRRNFISRSCAACVGMTIGASLFSSCTPSSYVQGKMGKDGITVNPSQFITKRNGKESYLSFIVIRNEALQYPICVFRFSDEHYSALWMQCTHQGAELSVSGDRLQCNAHGSEFDNKGTVKNGPADRHLRNFPVSIINKEIFIDLRAV